MSEASTNTNSPVYYWNDKNGPKSLEFLEPSWSNSQHQLCLYSCNTNISHFCTVVWNENKREFCKSPKISLLSLWYFQVLMSPMLHSRLLQRSTTKNSMFIFSYLSFYFSLHTDDLVFLTFISCHQCTKSNNKYKAGNKDRLLLFP